MPETAVHHFFGMRVLEKLPREIRECINPELYRTGVRGPDPLGIVRFWCPPVWKRLHGRSSEMHNRCCGDFFRRLSQEAREQTGELRTLLFSYECGFLTHYFLDNVCHPYVIYRTGQGKLYAGNHRSMEHAMDRIALERNGMAFQDRPISRIILRNNGLPDTMKQSIDAVYADVFGWKGAWRRINHALKDEIRFARIMEDPRGRMARFAKGGTMASISYAEKAYENADIRNEQHREWRNPYEPTLVSTQSFAELTEQAEQKAMRAICDLYSYLTGEGPYPVSIGDYSYESGLDTDDPRNQREPQSEVLKR